MTDQNNAAQAADTTPFSDEYVNAVIQQHGYDSPECVIARLHQWIGLHGGENGVTLLMYEAHKALVKLRAPVADERAADTLTQVYDTFGIGVLARNPSTLMACLGNVIRRANCLSQIERVLSVPTPPEPEDDGVWGEESLLRWGEDEKGYAEHFKAALAEWSRRAALASAPVTHYECGRSNGDGTYAAVPVRAPVADAPEAFENAWKNRPYLITGDTDKDKARRWWDAGRAAPSVAALAKDPFLAARAWREPTANAPVAGEAPPTDCQNALRIAELPEVDEALAVFCNDGTLDNAVGLVQAILDAAPQVSDGVLPAPCHDLRYHDQYRIGWNRCLDACRAALSAQPAEKPATSAPSPAASQRQAMIPASRESGNSHTDGGAVYE
jgi:hypothetical protein